MDGVFGTDSDLGGRDRLSTGERQLVQHAAVLGALITDTESRWLEGQPIDPTIYCTVINAQRRLFETVGLSRRQRDAVPSVAEYIEYTAADEEASPA
jgi:hypothetical protein